VNPFGGLGLTFVQNALLAGTSIAVLAGLVGYFLVLRSQVFAGDALSHVAYAGALAALAAGVDLRLGLFAATIGVGLALGALGGRGSGDDVVIGTAFAWVLGLGVFFLALYTTGGGSSSNSTASVSVLFGSVFGISRHDAVVAALVAAGLVVLLLAIGRPLLFATLDPSVAAARGVPVRLLGVLFLGLVGATTAEASQVVGALLLFGLVAAPAAAAQRLTDRPWRALWLSAALAVLAVWAGLALAYAVPDIPPSFGVVAVASACYAGSVLADVTRRRASSTTPATSTSASPAAAARR
jgi:zinc/manganese transport system permease protein